MEWSPGGHPGPHPPSPLTTARSRRDTRLAAWRTGHHSPPVTMWSPCSRTLGYLLDGKNNVLVQPMRIHLGPKSSILGLDPGHREVFSGFQVTHPFIYSSTYSPIYSFIFQYSLYPVIQQHAILSFYTFIYSHASIFFYASIVHPSIHITSQPARGK